MSYLLEDFYQKNKD
ncbi:hypothetical protein [Borreliella bavariensis]|nr:hypothetical protein [Borreliella bavariensis]